MEAAGPWAAEARIAAGRASVKHIATIGMSAVAVLPAEASGERPA
jgi:hypothetical protein